MPRGLREHQVEPARRVRWTTAPTGGMLGLDYTGEDGDEGALFGPRLYVAPSRGRSGGCRVDVQVRGSRRGRATVPDRSLTMTQLFGAAHEGRGRWSAGGGWTGTTVEPSDSAVRSGIATDAASDVYVGDEDGIQRSTNERLNRTPTPWGKPCTAMAVHPYLPKILVAHIPWMLAPRTSCPYPTMED